MKTVRHENRKLKENVRVDVDVDVMNVHFLSDRVTKEVFEGVFGNLR